MKIIPKTGYLLLQVDGVEMCLVKEKYVAGRVDV